MGGQEMKKSYVLLLSTLFVLIFSGAVSALTWDYTNDVPNVSITNDNGYPNSENWYQLDLPDWYDSRYVTKFVIDMYGSNDDSNYTIDIWRKLGDTTAPRRKIVGYDVTNGTRPFILEMNLMDMNLYYNYKTNGTWTGLRDSGRDLVNVSLPGFDSLDSFLIGYACHFTYDKTSIHIEQTQVPEPATLLLIGSGLAGLVGLRRRFKK
jgi:hypothetical protein